MRAWVVGVPRPADDQPLDAVDLPVPEPGPGEVRISVLACGVCRTDLHVAEGDLAPQRDQVVPGHEIVGEVDRLGPGTSRFSIGERIGIAWLRSTCGTCRACRHGAENLCHAPRFTGWTDHGGYAEHAVVPEAFAYRLPDGIDDEHAAPLLCSGIIGYRALLRSGFQPGDRLGIWGFGASAHLTAQVALAMGAQLHVVTRSQAGRDLALDLGAAWAGDAGERPPTLLDAAISFAPAGHVIADGLGCLARGGALAIAGIHVSGRLELDYHSHLFYERDLRSVTANTRADGEAFLAIAERLDLSVTTTPYHFDQAPDAIADLAHGRFTGAAVLTMDGRH